MRRDREGVAGIYLEAFSEIGEITLPPIDSNRIHAWHLFPIRLNLSRLAIDRNQFIEEMKARGVGYSVHWRPLHLHPLYMKTYGYCNKENFPVATSLWPRLVSLPIFSGMEVEEVQHVVNAIKDICNTFSKNISSSLVRNV